jgi:hypothetical protein
VPAVGHVILKLRGGNILAAVHPEQSEAIEGGDLQQLSLAVGPEELLSARW